MKDIMTAPFVEEMRKTTANMYRLGWDERNGGNISYMLEEAEVAEYLDLNNVIRTIPLGFDASAIIGKSRTSPLTVYIQAISVLTSRSTLCLISSATSGTESLNS